MSCWYPKVGSLTSKFPSVYLCTLLVRHRKPKGAAVVHLLDETKKPLRCRTFVFTWFSINHQGAASVYLLGEKQNRLCSWLTWYCVTPLSGICVRGWSLYLFEAQWWLVVELNPCCVRMFLQIVVGQLKEWLVDGMEHIFLEVMEKESWQESEKRNAENTISKKRKGQKKEDAGAR